MSQRSFTLDALLGALVTTLLLAVPFSELAGGFLAGYLHGEKGGRVGALSGIFAAVAKGGALYLLVVLLGVLSPEGVGQILRGYLLFYLAMALYIGALGGLAGYLGVYYRNGEVGRAVPTPEQAPVPEL